MLMQVPKQIAVITPKLKTIYSTGYDMLILKITNPNMYKVENANQITMFVKKIEPKISDIVLLCLTGVQRA